MKILVIILHFVFLACISCQTTTIELAPGLRCQSLQDHKRSLAVTSVLLHPQYNSLVIDGTDRSQRRYLEQQFWEDGVLADGGVRRLPGALVASRLLAIGLVDSEAIAVEEAVGDGAPKVVLRRLDTGHMIGKAYQLPKGMSIDWGDIQGSKLFLPIRDSASDKWQILALTISLQGLELLSSGQPRFGDPKRVISGSEHYVAWFDNSGYGDTSQSFLNWMHLDASGPSHTVVVGKQYWDDWYLLIQGGSHRVIYLVGDTVSARSQLKVLSYDQSEDFKPFDLEGSDLGQLLVSNGGEGLVAILKWRVDAGAFVILGLTRKGLVQKQQWTGLVPGIRLLQFFSRGAHHYAVFARTSGFQRGFYLCPI